jgi:hypothetical protein
MKRRFLAIFSIFVAAIVLVALVPGCDGGATTGTIDVAATLDASPWVGAVEYTLTGPGAAAPTIINGSSVPNSHTGEAGDWTCAYVSGGPPDTNFIGITPSPAQSLSAGATIGFTLNFETPPPPDASIEFDTWTINGEPVLPGPHTVDPGSVIDIKYKEHVSGNESAVVTVNQTSWFRFHYKGSQEGVVIHAVNALGGVTMSPPADKLYQMTSIEGVDAPWCTEHWAEWCVSVDLDVNLTWELVVCVNYTKTINWLGIRSAGPMILVENGPLEPEVLFDFTFPWEPVPGDLMTLTAWACIDTEGDANPENNCTEECPPLEITISQGPD